MLQIWAEALHLYNQGKRWNTWINDDRTRALCAKVQESATVLPPGFDEVLDYLNVKCPKVGDSVAIRDVKDYLRSETPYYHDVDKIINRFSGVIYSFGFERARVKKNGEVIRAYRRTESRSDE